MKHNYLNVTLSGGLYRGLFLQILPVYSSMGIWLQSELHEQTWTALGHILPYDKLNTELRNG